MNNKNILVTLENIQGELIRNEIELNDLQFQAFKEQKYNELLKENQKLKELKYKFFDASGDEESFTLEDYLDLSNKVYDFQEENKQLRGVIEEVRKSIKDFQEYIDEAKDFYGDLDDNDVVKVSNLQILNNQMVRNYDLLQILDKAKGE